jgi:phosphate transport system protein
MGSNASSVSRHRKSLDEGLNALQNNLLRMASLVDQAVDRSMQALRNRDQALAKKIIDGDAELNRLRYEVEEACLAVLATQQPAAGDLRTILAVDAIAVELERMGDHAEGIAKIVLRMGDEPPVKPLTEIPQMADLCRQMLKQSLDTFLSRDSEAARRVGETDDAIDTLYRELFDRLVAIMARDPSAVERGTYLLWIAHNLERIGDRITNIVERVIFMTTGQMGMIYP